MVTRKPLIALIKTSLSFTKPFRVEVSTTAVTQNCSAVYPICHSLTTFTLQCCTSDISCKCRPIMQLLVSTSEVLLGKARNICITNIRTILYFIRTIFYVNPTRFGVIFALSSGSWHYLTVKKYYWAVCLISIQRSVVNWVAKIPELFFV